MRSQKRLRLALSLVIILGACSQATEASATDTSATDDSATEASATDASATDASAAPTTAASPTTVVTTTSSTASLAEDWQAVDHPFVLAARASHSVASVTNAFDGLESTSWASGSEAPQWIELDLGQPRLIATVRLLVNQSPDGFTVHEVTAGAHDVPGMLIATVEGETQIGEWIVVPIRKEVEFIRITTTDSPSAVSWTEIDLMETG